MDNKKLIPCKQIGGKGTFRRKVIRRNSKKKVSSLELKTIEFVNNINKKILSLNPSNYIKFRNFMDELIKDYMDDLKRDDIDKSKSSSLRYADINTEGIAFIYKNFFYPVNDTKILIKSNVYNFINKNFKVSGKNLFFKFLESVDNILVQKEYNINLDSEKYNKEEFNRALVFFGMDVSKKVHFREIREKYNEIICKPNYDENTNFYFRLLRNQYENYINLV